MVAGKGGGRPSDAAAPPSLAVNAVEEDLDEAAAFCRQEGVGLEVATFASPARLDGDDVGERLDRHVEALDGVAPVLVHGPFLDLYPTSPDPEVVAVARRRHEQALRAAAALDARVYVAHLNSIPLITNPDYRERFVPAAAAFWSSMADRAGSSETTIVLENMWERGPGLQKQVVREADHPYVKASFDNGHALVFSLRDAGTWIRELGSDLAHLHLHDNDGAHDEHRPVGQGTEDWRRLVRAWREHAPGAVAVAEGDHLEVNRRSLSTLRGLLDRTENP